MKICLACGQQFAADDWHCSHCGAMPSAENGCLLFAPDLATGNGTDADYRYAELFEAEARNFWFKARNHLILWALGKYFPGARSFLEIGCGTGFVISGIRQAFPELALWASEILSRGLHYAQQRLPGISLLQMDAHRIPFADEFDVIGAFDVLEHIEDDQAVLSQMYQALKPSGGVIITVPQHPFLWSPLDEFAHHKRRYTRQELTNKLHNAGFAPGYCTSFITLPLPAMMLSRVFLHRRTAPLDPVRELRCNALVNALLKAVLRVEFQMIKNKLALPVGGSLLVVANRAKR